jgi:hypothetical protein
MHFVKPFSVELKVHLPTGAYIFLRVDESGASFLYDPADTVWQ